MSETLWKGTPVVAGRAGGIPLQMPAGVGGFLVDSVEECAARVLDLLGQPEEGRRLAEAGRERVREMFLLPRLVADDLRLYAEVIRREPARRDGRSNDQERGAAHRVVPGQLSPGLATGVGARILWGDGACALPAAVAQARTRAPHGGLEPRSAPGFTHVTRGARRVIRRRPQSIARR